MPVEFGIADSKTTDTESQEKKTHKVGAGVPGYLTRTKQDVFTLDVAMSDVMRMKVLQCLGHLEEDL